MLSMRSSRMATARPSSRVSLSTARYWYMYIHSSSLLLRPIVLYRYDPVYRSERTSELTLSDYSTVL